MFTFGWDKSKFDIKVKLCQARINMQRNKKDIGMKQLRRQVAELLRSGQNESARIKVESVIRDSLLLQAYNIIELYLELFTVRSPLISKTKEIPRDLTEAVASTIYASRRLGDIPELADVARLFTSKYGKEFAREASADAPACEKWSVNQNLVRCLLVEPPQGEEKLQALSDIAQDFKIENWDAAGTARELLAEGPPTGALVPPIPQTEPELGTASMGAHAPAAPGMDNFEQDPMAAAEAAAAALAHAQRLSDHAAALAQRQGAYMPMGTPQPPPPGWMNQHVPSMPPYDAAGPSEPPMPPPQHIQQVQPGYVVRSEEEIQRAYDEAVGPPDKGALKPPMPTPAPPPMPAPQPFPPPQMPPPPNNMEDECAALQARLQALRRP